MTTPELLPCPFCGGEARYQIDHTTEARNSAWCGKCDFGMFDPDETGSVTAAWNTRAPLSPAVLAELPEVRDLAERAAKAVLDEYRDSQGQWTFRQEHIENAIAQVFAAAIREGRG